MIVIKDKTDLLPSLRYLPGAICHAEEGRAPLGNTQDELEHLSPSKGVLMSRQGDMSQKKSAW
jgi:hypothetical protein